VSSSPVRAPRRLPRAAESRLARARALTSALSLAVALALSLSLSLASSSAARADDLADFDRARAAYDAQRYDEAVARFDSLVGGDLPRLQTRALVLESRKYLGAAYLFVGRPADARRQFELLLRDEPTYTIDPVTFPAEVRAAFEEVRRDLEREARARAEARAREEEERRRAEAERLLQERGRLLRLVELAQQETVVEYHSRLYASLPFGIGQFQNGHDGLGLALAVTEGLLAAASIAMTFLHASLPNPREYDLLTSADQRDVRLLESAFAITSYITFGAFVAVALAGIVDAHVRFVPTVTRTRRRELPEDLRDFP
jgi:tetratricopeptide (TPR) repeat protein